MRREREIGQIWPHTCEGHICYVRQIPPALAGNYVANRLCLPVRVRLSALNALRPSVGEVVAGGGKEKDLQIWPNANANAPDAPDDDDDSIASSARPSE